MVLPNTGEEPVLSQNRIIALRETLIYSDFVIPACLSADRQASMTTKSETP